MAAAYIGVATAMTIAKAVARHGVIRQLAPSHRAVRTKGAATQESPSRERRTSVMNGRIMVDSRCRILEADAQMSDIG